MLINFQPRQCRNETIRKIPADLNKSVQLQPLKWTLLKSAFKSRSKSPICFCQSRMEGLEAESGTFCAVIMLNWSSKARLSHCRAMPAHRSDPGHQRGHPWHWEAADAQRNSDRAALSCATAHLFVSSALGEITNISKSWKTREENGKYEEKACDS